MLYEATNLPVELLPCRLSGSCGSIVGASLCAPQYPEVSSKLLFSFSRSIASPALLFPSAASKKRKTMLACVGAKLTSSHDKQPVRMHSKRRRHTETKGKSTEDMGGGEIKVEAWRLEVSTWLLVNGGLQGEEWGEGGEGLHPQPAMVSLPSVIFKTSTNRLYVQQQCAAAW